MSIHRDLATAAEDLLRALTVVDVRVAAMRDAQNGQPGAQRFDSSGRASSLWCDRHERDVRDCELDGQDCDGQTIDLNDPTGEAAIRPDRAAAALRRLERLARRLRDDAAAVADELARWADNVATNDRIGMGECSDCHRYADGVKLRLSAYKGGDPVCPSCRARRDRRAVA